MSFQEAPNNVNFPDLEKTILAFWDQENIFAKSIEKNKDKPAYVFYDGPPFATGLPHYGHLLTCTIKDAIPRYWTMRGKQVKRTFGWDCHGLPVEYEMEKTLNLSGKKAIEDFGIDKFNESCRSIVLRYTSQWEDIVKRTGRWVDFRNGYRTMDRNYMESIWWVFKQLWDKGLIYEGYKILPYCPRCSTPLSNFEANQGYKDVDDPAITIRFKSLAHENTYFLAWTTTPWTLPSNMGLAVGPQIEYVFVQDGESVYVMAADRVSAYYKEAPVILKRCLGSALLNEPYEPLFDFFADKREQGAFRVVTADYVSTGDGTGIVHLAPGFGEDDAAAGKAHGIPDVCPIDDACCFTAAVAPYQGMYVKEADKLIIAALKEQGKLLRRDTIRHSYPHCWRDDSPLIYRAVSTYFVNIEKVKDAMLRANTQIRWIPEHLKEGRFGKWLENARDWAISRNRYWGCPLPVWRNTETGEVLCIGSVAELEEYTHQSVPDIHKHFVDLLQIPSQKFPGTVLTRVPQVLDCWFESGSMPYAQRHYPFENKELFEKTFPADFIGEGLDQTRGWFYTLVVLGAALFDKPAFKNVVVNGLILAEDGQKMSKRKRNYPDPAHIFDTYGADAMRLYLLSSQVVRAEDLRFSEKDGVREVLRSVLIPLWNAYSFFVTYANVDHYQASDAVLTPPNNPSNALDRWILSSLSELIESVRAAMDDYQLQKAATRFGPFIEDLTNWYIRRSRRRFWKSQNDGDKNEAYATLHYVLLTLAQCAAPFVPFISEVIYRNLRTAAMPESVHLCDFPEPVAARDLKLEKQMNATQCAVRLGRFLRAKHELKTRQVLAEAIVVCADEETRALLEQTRPLIAEELNVKTVQISADETELVTYSCKADFKVLGKKLGANMKAAAALIAALSGSEIAAILAGTPHTITLPDGTTYDLLRDDLAVQRTEKANLCVENEGPITVALQTLITPELACEGIARELVSLIQNERKTQNFCVSDRINVVIFTDDDAVREAVQKHAPYINEETLSLNTTLEPLSGDSVEVNGHACRIHVQPAEK